MPIDPTLLRPFLGELDTARAHAQSVRSAIDSIDAPGADPDGLLFGARMDAEFLGASLRAAPRHAAPRDAAAGALDLAGRSSERLDTLLTGLQEAIRSAGGRMDTPAVVERAADVRRAADRLLRWDLEELARVAREGSDGGSLGIADELGHWTSFEALATRELSDAAAVVRSDTDDLMGQLDDLDRRAGRDGADDGMLAALDEEIAIDEASRGLADIMTPAHFESAADRAGRSLEARAANAMDGTAREVHAMGQAPALVQRAGGLIVTGSDELLDAAPANGDLVATMVLRGEGETAAELPLVAAGRDIRFPTRESALSALKADSQGSWVLSPDRSGGWRAVQVLSADGDAADAMLDAYRAGKLEPSALRATSAAIRGFVVEGVPSGLRRDTADAAELAARDFDGFRATVRSAAPGMAGGLPSTGTPLVAIDLPSGLLRRTATFDLATGPRAGQVVDGTRQEALQAFRREAMRGGDHAAVLMKLDTGRYAIVDAGGASARQLHRAMSSGGAVPRMLDPRVEAFLVSSNGSVAGIDLVSGSRFAS